MTWSSPFARHYGSSGTAVVLMHGGPGAPGYLEPVANELAQHHRVLEVWQRRSGGIAPLTVSRHVNDLAEILQREWPDEQPALLGHSWGAMLGLAFATEYPTRASSLILVGCGTFDETSREELHRRRRVRTNGAVRRQLERIEAEVLDPDERLALVGGLFRECDSVELIKEDLPFGPCDARGLDESWADLMKLQYDGTYPAAFSVIDMPVRMLHGAQDPHPGGKIRDYLRTALPQLEYHEIDRCGHYPWLEKHAREEFYEVARRWLG